ncbi:XRE family transcriptional regulator [Alcanivorax xiamenensis]|uniref:XRE family transcriptional regulator n=1 Tax=Alcanivorax xiamenensis TaxID=1177156 RepID=A0ABQ6Y3S6_9GAMM|nr:helix-turn-helix transcriptional regulator [Alcanivorax xiamenensis]KAF0803623.1 XRE family transcriptional regulator [Alcanivorax xiamenensis]
MQAGTILADWRRTRRISQLELANNAGVSSRHLSFVENGRSRPSADMLKRLAGALDLSLRETNYLLTAAGHPPAFGETRLDEPAMAPVRQALNLMLENHLPYPAVVLDAHWNLLLANPAQHRIVAAMVAERGPLPETTNIMELAFHPDGFRPFIENWPVVASFLLRHLRRDLHARPDPVLHRLHRRLATLADLSRIPVDMPVSTDPMLTLVLNIGGQRLNAFSTLASFGTAVDVVMEELRIEQYFPADEATAQWFGTQAGGNGGG